ncbi:MAG TPA: ribosomal RNA small subunit methyltransferase A [Actinobacteria bacterium]|nr:ribosomal RNA small subunit methyltransferase A [Actinomycetota bacterium]
MQQYISSPKRTSGILSDHGIRLRKRLGQNYMIDTNSIKKMVSLAGIIPGETILEIGSGIGSLTEILIEKGAGRVICIEIDSKIADIFKDIFSDDIKKGTIKSIIKDAMDIDYEKLVTDNCIEKMVSNLPYKIAAPLMLKIPREAPAVKNFLVTIQKDMADRLMAKAGDKNYSSYTVKSNLLADYKQEFKISRNCFIPKPFVDSVVIGISRKVLPEGFNGNNDIEKFFSLVNNSFLHRRKKLLNSLALSKDHRIELDKIIGLLPEIGKNAEVRAQELSLEDYIFLFKNL